MHVVVVDLRSKECANNAKPHIALLFEAWFVVVSCCAHFNDGRAELHVKVSTAPDTRRYSLSIDHSIMRKQVRNG